MNELVQGSAGILPIATFAVWIICMIVGVLGMVLHYPRAQASPPPAVPVQAVMLNVEIGKTAEARAISEPPAPSPELPLPSTLADVASSPDLPRMIPLATPNPPIVFSVPVNSGETKSGPGTANTASGKSQASTPVATGVEHLVFGQGAGDQPPPEYPREAALARQEGTVVVRFVVDRNGNVESAEAIRPCPWPLLNQAAVRAIRENWRFAAGPVRSYEISIQFQLRQLFQ